MYTPRTALRSFSGPRQTVPVSRPAGADSGDTTSRTWAIASPQLPSAADSIGWANAPYSPKRMSSGLACGACGSVGDASTSMST
ncbi:Uncharacterised protein [Mycobacterium tuberculosis]|uniref:Uncharacterized protein n=1 Tax=Mycobacterium tuberculosis TaxID=1773 RepID=A0A916LC05_MYCTX|nr:Uncharacterised protein [Mycobacterium tuberculosis]COY47653.1 Uncharacterised protein [Mycobacterium tuberculosis]